MFMDLTTWLNWGLLALFMANVALLNWLTVTIIVHGERHTLAGWLVKVTMACSVLLLASDMQIIRSLSNAGYAPDSIPFGQAIFPGLIIPYVWYLITRQYCLPGQARKWYSVMFCFTTLLALGLALLLFGASFPHVMPLPAAELRPRIGPFSPAMLDVWPLFSLLCGALTLHMLRHITAIPGSQVSGSSDEIRQVRRMLQLISSGIVLGSLLLWAILERDPRLAGDDGKALLLAFSAIMTLCILVLGHLVIHFEIFTGHSLPRRDFLHYWQHAVALTVPLCALMTLSIAIKVHKIFVVLLLVLSASTYFAIVAARSYASRQRELASLRPFFTSRRLFGTLMLSATHSDRMEEECATIFARLCTDLLHTDVGFLIATGAFSPFIPTPLAHPRDTVPDESPDLPARCRQPDAPACLVLDPPRADGAKWAVPLRSDGQLVGILLLGANRQQDVYTREEITLAVTSSVLLLDQLAGTRKAQQLISALRQKIADQQVLDLRPRRVLHDEIANHLILLLRQVHNTSISDAAFKRALAEQLQAILGEVGDLLAVMPNGLPSEIASLGLVAALRLMIDDYYREEFDEVVWQVDDEVETAVQALPARGRRSRLPRGARGGPQRGQARTRPRPRAQVMPHPGGALA